MKRSLIFILSFLSFMGMEAQTVVWQMKPADYNSIERINSNLYKVTRNGKIGLINADGTIVADAVNDNLSDYYEHKALLTVNDGSGERVSGCLTDDGRYFAFSEKYYTLNGQKFFSDGVLSVSDARKQVGYIDESGTAVVGFDGKYDKIKPFVEGHAAVFKNKKYFLIDKNGVTARFKFDGVGEVYGGTNACNGKVYIWDTGGAGYTYDIATPDKTCKRMKLPSNTSFDYLYRFSAVSGKSKEVPFVNEIRKGTAGLNPVVINGQYGFKTETGTILPCQLTSATPFEDNYSVASIDGGIGILRYVDGEGFAVSSPTESKNFFAGEKVKCTFTLNTPTVWRGKELHVVVKDENGSSIATSNVVNTYSFEITPSQSGTKEYIIAVYSERLKLYAGSISYKFVRMCSICKKDWNICRGNHTPTETKKDERCPTCGKLIKDCDKNGVH